jgi:hypothetical protein
MHSASLERELSNRLFNDMHSAVHVSAVCSTTMFVQYLKEYKIEHRDRVQFYISINNIKRAVQTKLSYFIYEPYTE